MGWTIRRANPLPAQGGQWGVLPPSFLRASVGADTDSRAASKGIFLDQMCGEVTVRHSRPLLSALQGPPQ